MVLVEMLDEVLEETWRVIGNTYDVCASLPELERLFEGADLTAPAQAAETVLVNMLSEVIESMGRFSPWYRAPARAFGLIAMRELPTNRLRWMLAPEAVQRWELLLEALAVAIERNVGLIQATQLVGDLMKRVPPGDPCVTASCLCQPQRVILVNRSVLLSTKVICCCCQQPFRVIEPTD